MKRPEGKARELGNGTDSVSLQHDGLTANGTGRALEILAKPLRLMPLKLDTEG